MRKSLKQDLKGFFKDVFKDVFKYMFFCGFVFLGHIILTNNPESITWVISMSIILHCVNEKEKPQ